MEMAIIYFGISQSIFAGIFTFFFKRPSSIADKILGGWFLTISLMFILNLLKKTSQIAIDLWPISVNVAMAYPICLFLYTRYITKEYKKFDRKDLFHFIPILIGIMIVSIFYNPKITNLNEFAEHYSNLVLPRNIVGWFFNICLWGYSIVALIIVYRYKKKIRHVYSFKSYKINLIWLQFVIITFLILYHFIIIVSAFQIDMAVFNNIELFRSGTLLIFLYILSFGGLQQKQLISENEEINLNTIVSLQKSTDTQYLKSSLKDEQAEEYLKRLVDFMNTSGIWKDNELSIAKVADHSGISRHHITQILNQYLQKNFNTFVNEYRVEHAKQMFGLKNYANWSILAIAYECGFNSKATFNSFFKKYTGITPSEYKNRIREELI